jgi:hypothetical protein
MLIKVQTVYKPYNEVAADLDLPPSQWQVKK